jgi:hypothetical protein
MTADETQTEPEPVGATLLALLRDLAAGYPPEAQYAAVRMRAIADFLEAGGDDQQEALAGGARGLTPAPEVGAAQGGATSVTQGHLAGAWQRCCEHERRRGRLRPTRPANSGFGAPPVAPVAKPVQGMGATQGQRR